MDTAIGQMNGDRADPFLGTAIGRIKCDLADLFFGNSDTAD
jgi:hypothetical protein